MATTESGGEELSTLVNKTESESFTADFDSDYEDFMLGLYSDKIPEHVEEYDRHVFLSFKSALSSPVRIKDVATDPLPARFALALRNREDEIRRETKFSVFEGGAEAGFSDGDVLIFPDMIKYKNLSLEAVDDFVEDVLIKETTSRTLGKPQKLTGFHIFVCFHPSKDGGFCGCGTVLTDKFKEEIKLRGLENQVFVSPCSHVGRHVHSGGIVVFGPDCDKQVMGHWYSYIIPRDVPLLLDQHVQKGLIIPRWRSQVCHTREKKLVDLELNAAKGRDKVSAWMGKNLVGAVVIGAVAVVARNIFRRSS